MMSEYIFFETVTYVLDVFFRNTKSWQNINIFFSGQYNRQGGTGLRCIKVDNYTDVEKNTHQFVMILYGNMKNRFSSRIFICFSNHRSLSHFKRGYIISFCKCFISCQVLVCGRYHITASLRSQMGEKEREREKVYGFDIYFLLFLSVLWGYYYTGMVWYCKQYIGYVLYGVSLSKEEGERGENRLIINTLLHSFSDFIKNSFCCRYYYAFNTFRDR